MATDPETLWTLISTHAGTHKLIFWVVDRGRVDVKHARTKTNANTYLSARRDQFWPFGEAPFCGYPAGGSPLGQLAVVDPASEAFSIILGDRWLGFRFQFVFGFACYALWREAPLEHAARLICRKKPPDPQTRCDSGYGL